MLNKAAFVKNKNTTETLLFKRTFLCEITFFSLFYYIYIIYF